MAMHGWWASLSHAAGFVERPLEFGMAKAGAREMVLGETSDDATGSSRDVTSQHEIWSDNPKRRYCCGCIDSSRCGRDTRAMTVAVAMAMAAAVAIVAVIAMVLVVAMAMAMVLATVMTMAIVMVLAIVVAVAMAIAIPDHTKTQCRTPGTPSRPTHSSLNTATNRNK